MKKTKTQRKIMTLLIPKSHLLTMRKWNHIDHRNHYNNKLLIIKKKIKLLLIIKMITLINNHNTIKVRKVYIKLAITLYWKMINKHLLKFKMINLKINQYTHNKFHKTILYMMKKLNLNNNNSIILNQFTKMMMINNKTMLLKHNWVIDQTKVNQAHRSNRLLSMMKRKNKKPPKNKMMMIKN